MKIVICDDDPTTNQFVQGILCSMGHEPIVFSDSTKALVFLASPSAPKIAILDWIMPGYSGIDICREIRKRANALSIFVLMLTARGQPEDVAEALDAGANDYITKPLEVVEFKARVANAEKMVLLQNELRTLTGLLHVCSWCKKIRNEKDEWVRIEEYVEKNSYAQFSHVGCPDCREAAKPDLR